MADTLLEQLGPLRVGEAIELPPLLPGLTREPLVGRLTERDEFYWGFELRLFDCYVGKAAVEAVNGKLEFTDMDFA